MDLRNVCVKLVLGPRSPGGGRVDEGEEELEKVVVVVVVVCSGRSGGVLDDRCLPPVTVVVFSVVEVGTGGEAGDRREAVSMF